MTPTVREAHPEEFSILSEITLEANQEYAGSFREEWEDYRVELADIAGRAATGTVLVAEVDGHPAGTVTYYPPLRHDGADAPHDFEGWRWWARDVAYLRTLAVRPGDRGRGAGRALTLACIEMARRDGAAGIALNTTDLMTDARGLYERLGFQPVPSHSWSWGDHKLLAYILTF